MSEPESFEPFIVELEDGVELVVDENGVWLDEYGIEWDQLRDALRAMRDKAGEA